MNQIADALFLSRAMGAPVPPGKDWAKWTSAALSNAERRAAAVAHIDALLGQLPTEEDAARTPVEAPKRDAAPVDPSVYDSAGHLLGGWQFIKSGNVYRVVYEGECPCESGHDFRVCHGADSLADEAQSAQNGAS